MGDLVERLRNADTNSQQRVLGSRYGLVPLQKEPDHE